MWCSTLYRGILINGRHQASIISGVNCRLIDLVYASCWPALCIVMRAPLSFLSYSRAAIAAEISVGAYIVMSSARLRNNLEALRIKPAARRSRLARSAAMCVGVFTSVIRLTLLTACFGITCCSMLPSSMCRSVDNPFRNCARLW